MNRLSLLLTISLIILSQCNSKTSQRAEIPYDSIRVVLEKVFDSDQHIRRIIQDSIGYDSPETPAYFSKMISIDKDNQDILMPVLLKYGWLPKSKIGEKASDAIFCVIQHGEHEVMNEYFPQLDSLAQIGEASKTNAAMMEDRLLVWKGLKQKYGTQATRSLRADKVMVIWPIEDTAGVDRLRKEAGFELTVLENA